MTEESKSAGADHVGMVKRAFAAALAGDVGGVSNLLAEDVRWYGAGGNPSEGCANRRQALSWLGETIARGVSAEILDARALDDKRVLVRLRRKSPDDGKASTPHAQIVTFRGEEVSEIVVFPTEADALTATRRP